MAPPPSQAGKFKPRKPAKKIRAGEATPVVVPSSNVPPIGAAVAPPARAPPASVGRSTTGRGGRASGRGGGRGGRISGTARGGGGRGRGIAPVPQGQVFFTATKPAPMRSRAAAAGAPANKSSSTTNRSKSPGRAAVGKRDVGETSHEEVVGVLDDMDVERAVQPAAVASSGARARAESALDYLEEQETGGKSTKKVAPRKRDVDEPGFYYDDDSSEQEQDEDDEDAMDVEDAGIQPVVLPFPAPLAQFSLATGSALPPISSSSSQILDAPSQEDWFLVQMPTRLPPLVQSATAEPTPVKMEEDTSEPATVAVAPLKADRFDNAMANAVPGRLGKLVVYKSGKTVLVLEAANGSSSINMDITEHGCNFRQQAVSIDPTKGEFVTLGPVRNTLIATPELANGFSP